MKLPLLFGGLVAMFALGCGPSPSGAPTNASTEPAQQQQAAKEPAGETAAPAAEKVDIKTLVGQPVPPFEFVFMDGNQKTSADFEGQVVLLDFWASWCTTCKAASPVMQKLHEQYGDKGLAVIAVNTFESSDPNADKNTKILASAEASKNYAEEHKYTYLFATFGDPTAERWSIGGVPMFVLIGKDGKILMAESNAKPETLKKIEEAVAKALG